MKKKSIAKLKLKKSSISTLNQHVAKGGIINTLIIICGESIVRCITIHYTQCYGNRHCQKYANPH